MRKSMTIAATALGLAATSVAPASAAPEPSDGITVRVVTVNGSGCRAGTAHATPLPDNTGFRVTYSDYLAQAGGNSNPTDSRKNCQINVAIHIPHGHTYAIASVEYRGYAHLQPGANGLEKASYYFQGQPETRSVSHPIRGPYSDNWKFTDTTEVYERVYKPCGQDRNLNINTELRVDAGATGKVSFMSMDDTRAEVDTIYHFSWRPCP